MQYNAYLDYTFILRGKIVIFYLFRRRASNIFDASPREGDNFGPPIVLGSFKGGYGGLETFFLITGFSVHIWYQMKGLDELS